MQRAGGMAGEPELLERLGERERALDERLTEARAERDRVVEEARRRAESLLAEVRERITRELNEPGDAAPATSDGGARLAGIEAGARARWEDAIARILERVRSVP